MTIMKNAMTRLLASFCVAGLVGSVGCLAPESEVDTTEAEDPVFTVTVVDLDQGGIVVAEYTERLSEQIARRDLEAHGGAIDEALGTTSDGLYRWFPCNSLHLQMWDATNYTGNRLCLGGTGLAPLSTWGWSQRVRSMKTGNTAVRFGPTNVLCCQSCPARSANQNVSNAACESDETWLWRNEYGTCGPC